MTLVLLALSLAAVPVSRRMTGDYLTPVALVVSAWCGALGLFSLRLLPYAPMRLSTWLTIGGTVLALVAGAVAGQRLARLRPTHLVQVPTRPSAWVLVYSLLGLMGTAWYVWVVVHYMGPDAFSTPHQVRIALGEYRIPSTYLFLQFFCMASPMLAMATSLAGYRLGPLAWALVTACVLSTWITTDRTPFFLVTLAGFFMFVYRKGPALRWSGFVAASIVCVLLLATNFAVVGMWVGKTPQALGVVMRVPAEVPDRPPAAQPSPAPVTPAPPAQSPAGDPGAGLPADPHPKAGRGHALLQRGSTVYLYLTGSFAALDVLLAEAPDRTGGVHVAYPIARALYRLGLLAHELPPAIPAFRNLRLTSGNDISFNGYTFLYYPWMDFGVAGALIYAFVVGLGSGVAYMWVRGNRASPARLLVLAHVATALVLSIFVNKFNNTASWYVALFTVLPFMTAALVGRFSPWSPGR